MSDLLTLPWQGQIQAVALTLSFIVIGNGVIQNVVQLLQLGIAGWHILRTKPVADGRALWLRFSDMAMPISLIVPAYNEANTIIENVRSLLSLHYPAHDVIVVNDGSQDDTLARLIDHFSLYPVKRAYQTEVLHAPIRQIFGSKLHDNLIVVDKINGGKADAQNAGINVSHKPLFCTIDADSILEADSLIRAVQPFLLDPERVVAVGGTIRVINGCTLRSGRVEKVGLPRSPLALLQTIEYLRAFLVARLAWSEIGTLMLISGAFGLFRRDVAISVGGYSQRTVGEDLEIIIKIHRHFRDLGQDYVIDFLPEPVCWTEVPTTWRILASQRCRWQRGALETFFKHKDMLFGRRYGRIGVLGMGHILLVDVIGPPIEAIGYALIPLLCLLGLVSWDHLLAFATLVFVFGVFTSVGALILEEAELRRFPRASDLLLLLLVAVIENFGYRQVNNIFRLVGCWQFLRKTGGWGNMVRTGFNTS